MKKIQMVDLYRQYLKIKPEVDASVQKVIDSSEFIKGTKVREFENNLSNYLNVKNVINCGNGTDALQIALMASGLKPGDEVITTPFTFVSTVEVIALLGLVPVFSDVEESSFNIDPAKIEKAISPKTKAIIPVHLFGRPADMQRILAISKKYNLFIIEDAAQSTGANYLFSDGTKVKTGTIGNIGCTSFFPSKNLGCFGDGGAIFTNDNEIGEKLRIIANHGMKNRYHYDEIGVNSRLDTVQAAILNVKLKYLDNYNKLRRNAAKFYNNKLKEISQIVTPSLDEESVFHQYTILIKDNSRDNLKNYLESKKIPSAVYYPLPLHLQKAYQILGYKKGDFPVAEYLSSHVLSLPMHTELDVDQLNYICDCISEFYS